MVDKQYICIGSFEQTIGTIIISDPSYSPSSKHFLGIAGEIKNVKPGTYYAVIEVIKSEKRNAALYIFHEDYFSAKKGILSAKTFSEIYEQFNYKTTKKQNISVDAGMAGFYDKKFFEGYDNLEWYEDVVDHILKNPKRALILPYGVISDSGYGDGSYDYFTAKIDGKVVSAFVWFICDEEDEDEE